jgi:hypothetical protein
VLVFLGQRAEEIMTRTEIDPHFREEGFSPIARFAPSIEGKTLAMALTKS